MIDFQKDIINAKISLTNAEGRIVWIKDSFSGKQLQFNSKDLAGGTYFIVIESEWQQDKLAFIKE